MPLLVRLQWEIFPPICFIAALFLLGVFLVGALLLGALLVGASPLPHSLSSIILFLQNKPVVQDITLESVHVGKPNKNIS